MAGVRQASDASILAVPGVTRRHLAALRKVIPAPPIVSGTGEEPGRSVSS
jgi:hypothetical protein